MFHCVFAPVLNALKMFSGRLDRLVAEPERPADLQLQVLRILVADLAVAARRSLEAEAIRERVRLRRAVGEPHGRRAVDRIGRRQLDEERSDVAAGLDDVAAAHADPNGASHWPPMRSENGRYAAPDSRPPPFSVLSSPLPNSCCDRSRLFGNASGCRKRAGSVGFHVPLRCCHWRVKLAIICQLFDMFLANVASTALTITCVHVALVSCRMRPWFGSTRRTRRTACPGPVGIDAVDIDFGEVVVEAALRGRHADADLPAQLAVVAHRELVELRLVQVLVEEQLGSTRSGSAASRWSSRLPALSM